MKYQRIPIKVDAIKLSEPTQINGKTGQPGDYLLTLPGGKIAIMTGKVFEASFEPIEAGFAEVAAPDLERPTPQEVFERKSLMICLGCGDEVTRDQFEPKSGMCVRCLKQQVTCQTCDRDVFQYEVIGLKCRHCLGKPAL